MWHDIVSQADTEAAMFALGFVGLVSRYSMLAIAMLIVSVGILALTWNEVLKAQTLQARWDAERAKWDSGIRMWR